MKTTIKAIIFDWGRTLYDAETKKEFPEAERIVDLCVKRGYKLAVASFVSSRAVGALEERRKRIEKSPVRKFFEIVAVTDEDKDKILDEIVLKFNLPRNEIMIVDDRIVRGIKYGNLRNHPTVWLQKGKFSGERPSEETGQPTFTIRSLEELVEII